MASRVAEEGVAAARGVSDASTPAEEGIAPARRVRGAGTYAEEGIADARRVRGAGICAKEGIVVAARRVRGAGICAEEGIVAARCVRGAGIYAEEGVVTARSIRGAGIYAEEGVVTARSIRGAGICAEEGVGIARRVKEASILSEEGVSVGRCVIYLASSPSANESNAIRIGTGGIQTTAFIAGISGNSVAAASGTSVFVDANGRLGTILSSRRFKQNIRAMGNATARLMQLRPVTFLYKPEVVPGEQPLQYGLIAEEVAKIYPDLVQYAADGQSQTVRYHLLNPMLLNEVQKQRRQIESQTLQLQSQTQKMTQQAQQISALETRLRRLELGASRR